MTRVTTSVCCVLLTILAGCATGGGWKGDHRDGTDDECCLPNDSVPATFTTLIETTGSPSTDEPERFEVIRSQDRLDAVWNELFAPNPPSQPVPNVDFASRVVIVYAAGTKPNGCYSAEIVEVRRAGQALFVEAVETVPAPNCVCTMSLVMPFHVIELDRYAGPASLCVRTKLRDC